MIKKTTRRDFLQAYAEQHQLLFTLQVLQVIEEKGLSLTAVAKYLGGGRDTLRRLLQMKEPEAPSVQGILKIAEMLELDPVQSLNQYFFGDTRAEQAREFYSAFTAFFLDASEEERVQAFGIADRFLKMPVGDRVIFTSMLDAFQAREQATPPKERGPMDDTPSEE